MKKIVAIFFSVLMLLGCFAGCSQDKESNATKAPEATNVGNSDWEYIKNKGELIVGITLFAPMNYEDDKGELTGFETEFARAVGEKLGVSVKFQVIDWNAKVTELDSKAIDCIWNGMTITDELKEKLEISNPYMANKQVVVVKAENVDKYTDALTINGAIAVAENGSAGEIVASTNEIFSGANFTAVQAQANVLMEVLSGTADLGIIDYVMSIGSIGQGTDYADLTTVQSLEFNPEEYGIAFRKGSDAVEKVNTAMSELASDGTLNEIAAKYKLQDLLLVK